MDKVGDLLIRIKNGYLAYKAEVVIPYSKLGLAICQLLLEEGYLASCQVQGENPKQGIVVGLKYEQKRPVLTDVKRISKPGRRVYKNHKLLPFVQEGLGIAIISTPKGVMSDKQARKEKVGGEVLAYIW